MYNSQKLLGREIGKIKYDINKEIAASRPTYSPMGPNGYYRSNTDKFTYVERTSKMHNTIGTYNPFMDITVADQTLVPWGFDFEKDDINKGTKDHDHGGNDAKEGTHKGRLLTPSLNALLNKPVYNTVSKISW